MKGKHILSKPTDVSELSVDGLDSNASGEWRNRAAQSQIRRWRNLKRLVRGDREDRRHK